MSVSGLLFFFFIGSSAFAQEPTVNEIKPLTFKTQAELDAWINANPEEYARIKSRAEEVSATYIGQLLIVGSETPKKEEETASNNQKADGNTAPVKQGKAPAGVSTPVELEGFPVMENTGNPEADQKRYEEAKKEWYEQNKK